ncbi:MAG: SGNH/GDSL hydrolase family protein [Desulfobulbaceae bacterium]|nr:SGNH/GDSL hydrolase family protein [Desulfobulbaceae bacterium]
MRHLVLLGDSILDNGSYVGNSPDVSTQVKQLLPEGWLSSLLAVDGAKSNDVKRQLIYLPPDASHLVLSMGGNDALMRIDVLRMAVDLSSEAFLILADTVALFELSYREAIEDILAYKIPLIVCTIYNANFPDPFQKCIKAALAVYNDVIIRVATENNLTVIDLRHLCSEPEDYANSIEPSAIGGAKIAAAIVNAATNINKNFHGANILGLHNQG